MGTMAILDKTGHQELRWKVDDPTEVAKAKAVFDDLRRRGYVAFALTKAGNPGGRPLKEFKEEKGVLAFKPSARLLKTFEVEVEEIVLQPAVAGG